MPGLILHQNGNDCPDPIYHPLGATQTFVSMDPVGIAADLLTAVHSDGVKVLDTELIGFAATGALGEQSATRTGLAYGGGPGGNATQTMRSFYPATPSLLIRTRNFYTTAAGTAQAAKLGTNRGAFFQIAANNVADNVAQWGVVNVAGVIDTDAVAHIVDVLDDNLQPIASTTTLTAGQGWIVFRIIGNNQWAGGVATVAS